MMDWSISDIVDAVLAPTSIALLVAYHAFLCYKVRTSPLNTVMGINRRARRLWVYDMLIVIKFKTKNSLLLLFFFYGLILYYYCFF